MTVTTQVPSGERIAMHLTQALWEISRFTESEPFQRMLAELDHLPFDQRDHFVRTVLLHPEELALRGLTPPPDIKIQRSWFGDQRPTIFCVVKYLPGGRGKATITFDAPEFCEPDRN